MSRLPLTIALMVSVIPSIGMAGVIIDDCGIESSQRSSISACLGGDVTPEPVYPERLKEHRETAGFSSVSVNTISGPSSAIDCLGVWLFKPVPPLESSFGLDEWQFVPDSPVFKIPRVPIV